MVARPPEAAGSEVQDGWLPAGTIRLDGRREARLSYDASGTARLTLTLDGPVRGADLEALDQAADLLPFLEVQDLDGGVDFPDRHAEAFGRTAPLAARSFGRFAVVEVVAEPGGVRVPERLGIFGVPVWRVGVVDRPAAVNLGDYDRDRAERLALGGLDLPALRAPTPPATAPPARDPAGEDPPGAVDDGKGDAEAEPEPEPRTGDGGDREVATPGQDEAGARDPDPPVTDSVWAVPERAPAGPATREADQADHAGNGQPRNGQGDQRVTPRAAGQWAPHPMVVPESGGLGVAALAGVERLGALLGAAGQGVQRVSRIPAVWLCRGLLGLAVVGFVAAFVRQTWTNHARFGTYGFDLGIFDQGTWLLSQLHDPFVTIRGLHLFGDHASYILALVAPLYHLWADPRLLLLLQVLGLTAPALAIFHLARTRLANPAAALTLALAYLAYPGMQWAITWQFHPETLAAGFLAGAVVAADTRRGRLLALCVTLALLCKEDVGLVVAGLGLSLWLTGQPVWGKRLLLAGLGWFLLAVFVLIPLVNGDGDGSPHFALNYGIEGTGFGSLLLALPALAGKALTFSLSNGGVRYLFLVFMPLALLPLASWRWLAPVAGPIALNLAATHTYQHEIRYQYLATSAPFLALAAVAGLAALAARRRDLLGPLCVVLLVCAGLMSYHYGPALWAKSPALGGVPVQAEARQEAIAAVPDGAGVSAQYHLITHLAHREHAYEWPNPFIASNWGHSGDEPGPEAEDAVDYVILEPRSLEGDRSSDNRALDKLKELREAPEWEVVYDNGGVLVLRRTAGGDGLSPPATPQERE